MFIKNYRIFSLNKLGSHKNKQKFTLAYSSTSYLLFLALKSNNVLTQKFLFSETSEHEAEKPPTIFKNKNLSLDSLNPQALMLLQAYFAQTTKTATSKDVQSQSPSKVEVRKTFFKLNNFSDVNSQVLNRSLHCFAQ